MILSKNKTEFQPVTFTVTLETEKEVIDLWKRFLIDSVNIDKLVMEYRILDWRDVGEPISENFLEIYDMLDVEVDAILKNRKNPNEI